jgi:hypothetical protein
MTRNPFALAAIVAGLAACADQQDPAGVEPILPSPAADVVLESAGPPFYTIAANGAWVPNDGKWAVFPFLRELGCVPDDANLFAIVGPMAFACAATVEGHEHWENGPGIDPAPRQTVFRGLGAVPIVFALLTDVEAVIGDGKLTLPELLALPSAIVGTARFYKEIDVLGISGPHGAGRGMYKINAWGALSDGGSFRLHLNEVLGEQRVVQIEFFD